jgi:iron-sulfur cluster assembly accessory protein
MEPFSSHVRFRSSLHRLMWDEVGSPASEVGNAGRRHPPTKPHRDRQEFVRRGHPDHYTRSIRVTGMTETVLPPFAVTAAAIRQLEVMGGSARVDIRDGGCCGSTYVFTQDAGIESDTRSGCVGAELFVSDAARVVLTGATLDYSATIKPARFRVMRNPNTPTRCPCNRSFGRDWPGKAQPGCMAKSPMPWNG